jgi:hypothetical protein
VQTDTETDFRTKTHTEVETKTYIKVRKLKAAPRPANAPQTSISLVPTTKVYLSTEIISDTMTIDHTLTSTYTKSVPVTYTQVSTETVSRLAYLSLLLPLC